MRKTLVLLFALTVSGCGKEALYKGKPARYWRERLHDPQAQVRREAATAMGALKVTDAIPELIAMLKDDDGGVRSRAAEALWGIGGSEAQAAVTPLISLLEDEDAGIRLNAVGALG